VFCNFDGCYSKRGGGGAGRSDTAAGVLRREPTDPVQLLLLRLHPAASEQQRSDLPDRDDLTSKPPSSAANLETAAEAPISDHRRNQWTNRRPTCCPGAALARILQSAVE